MKEIKQIVTANFTEVNKLINDGYVCVSIVGKVYGEYDRIEEIQRIRSLNTFRHWYHIKTEDWFACNILYRAILNKKGIERLKADLLNLVSKQNKSKIALLGYGEKNDFCYRHILSDYLNTNGITVTEVGNVDLNIQKAYWKKDPYKKAGHYNLTDKCVGQVLEKSEWIYAKTMPLTPHHYVLRKNFGNNNLFLHIVAHIRYFGKAEIYEGQMYRVFYYNTFKYWTMSQDITNEECDLINRKLI